MGRKNLLSGLLPPASESPAPAVTPDRPRPARGAIGAVSQSIADLRARSVLEIDPFVIDAGGMQDRLEADPVEDAALARSIAEYGQQVPVLVRPHPSEANRYQIVYGRRRVLALRDLRQPVKALVRDLDDRELVMAQGQENTARRDLSFIEKANFARQMTAAGYDRKAICDALNIDKTVISRMLSVAERVPEDLLRFIGAAPAVGRDRWLLVAERIAEAGHDAEHLKTMVAAAAPGAGSDERFATLQAYLERRRERPAPSSASPRARAPSQALRAANGTRLGAARLTDHTLMLRLDRAQSAGFEDWLLDRLPELHRDWLSSRGE